MLTQKEICIIFLWAYLLLEGASTCRDDSQYAYVLQDCALIVFQCLVLGYGNTYKMNVAILTVNSTELRLRLYSDSRVIIMLSKMKG